MGIDVGLVDQAFADHHVNQAEGERGIAPRAQLQVQVGGRRGLVAHGIDHDHFCRAFLQPVLVGMRCRMAGVGAPDQDAGAVPGRARIEADVAVAEDVTPGDVAGVVADRVGFGFGRAQPGEEPARKADRQGGTGAGVMGVQDAVEAALAPDGVEPLGDGAERLVPGDRGELAAALGPGAFHRVEQAHLGIEPDAVVGHRALAAERAARRGVIGIAQHLGYPAVALDHGDAAAVVAVARTGGLDDLAFARHDIAPCALPKA